MKRPTKLTRNGKRNGRPLKKDAEKKKEVSKVLQRIEDCKTNPEEFISRFLYTFNPKKDPYHLPFKLFPFQRKLVWDLKELIEKGEDVFIEKCREMGATYTVLDVFLWFWLYIPGSNFLLGSRKEQYVDNTKGGGGLSNKEESLFGKLEYTIGRMYPFMLPEGFSLKKHCTYMSILNPVNGNVISGESSNPNFSRGGRFKAILLDEFAFWDNGSAAWGSTADTTQCRIVLTTPGLQPSKAKRLRYGTDGEEIKIITLPYHLDPRKTKEWIKKEKTRRSDSDFSREIMINWETSTAGRVYPEIELSEMIINEYEERLMLYCSWDFGLDGTAIQWWQKKDKWVLIDSYQNTNKPITWFVPFVGGKIDSTFSYTDEDLRIIKNHASWKDGVHFGDPDVSKRNLVTGTSTRQTLEAANIYVQTNTESNDFASRREKTKVFLQTGILVNKTIGNEIWMDCIREARYPQRAETAQVTTPIVKPIHDQTSHHRTALEYFCVNIDEHKPGAITRESSTNQLENKIGNQSLTESLTQLL